MATIGGLRLVLLIALTCVAATSSARAQAGSPGFYINPYGGIFLVSDSEMEGVGMSLDAAPVAGLRVGREWSSAWALEASYGYGFLTADVEGQGEVDGDLHFYSAALVWRSGGGERRGARFLATAGVGGMRYSYQELHRQGVRFRGTSWGHDPVIEFGVGMMVDLGDRVALRVDVRDHLQFCHVEEAPITESDDFSHCPLERATLHNPAITGGFRLRI